MVAAYRVMARGTWGAGSPTRGGNSRYTTGLSPELSRRARGLASQVPWDRCCVQQSSAELHAVRKQLCYVTRDVTGLHAKDSLAGGQACPVGAPQRLGYTAAP